MSPSRQHSPTTRRQRRRPRAAWLAASASALVTAAVVATIVLITAPGSSRSRSTVVIPKRTGADLGLDVLPFPGTPDASQSAQITFPALLPYELKSVTVTGSHSGRHAGRLLALPGRRGTAFVPHRMFSAGEQVHVNAHLSSPAAGTATGAPLKTEVSFSFQVARPSAQTSKWPPNSGTHPKPKAPPTQSFQSAPDLDPPMVKRTVDDHDADDTSGDFFLTAHGLLVLNARGQVVWFDRSVQKSHLSTLNLRVQHYRGKPVLTWWQGRIIPPGYGAEGQDVIVNRAYQRVATVRGAEGYSADLHEFRLTRGGTALITASVPVKADLSSVGGPRNGSVLDSVVQEIDVRTGRLLWTWHALGHVPISACEVGKPQADQPYDYFHINSIQQLPNGNLLISARNTWAVYEIARATGHVLWTLGGKNSNFRMGKGTRFYWQHDAQLHPGDLLTVFDDGATPKKENQSRALELNLDLHTMRASLKHAYTHSPPLLAGAQGNVQLLPNGNVLVGWGTAPAFSEYAPSGKQIWDGQFTPPVYSYRAYRSPWRAEPAVRPAISVKTGQGGAVTVFVSWNGATDVARWQVLAGKSKNDLAPVATVKKTGFETAIRAKTADRYIAARALSHSGRALAISRVTIR
jgi:Arylsulfotransferase (ASST)